MDRVVQDSSILEIGKLILNDVSLILEIFSVMFVDLIAVLFLQLLYGIYYASSILNTFFLFTVSITFLCFICLGYYIILFLLLSPLLILFLTFYVMLSSISYYKNQSLKEAFDIGPADPTVDLNTQL